VTAAVKIQIDHGTPEAVWRTCVPLATCPLLDDVAIRSAVILAPHPDDEVLALGGTMQVLALGGCELSIVAITDGEASHPGRAGLADLRAREREAALARLDLGDVRVTRLHCPDGGVARARDLVARLEPLIAQASHCFATWELDGHPDHEATGRAARAACARTGTRLLSYPVWAWHGARPRDLPWPRARRIELDLDTREAKWEALEVYRSQLLPLDDAEAIVPPPVLAHFQRPFELVFEMAPRLHPRAS
jgi:LmbE family N-acetylglucosaminyl deacetylase